MRASVSTSLAFVLCLAGGSLASQGAPPPSAQPVPSSPPVAPGAARTPEEVAKDLQSAREKGDRAGALKALGDLGELHRKRGESQAALREFEEALGIAREIADCRSEAAMLCGAGKASGALGEDRKSLDYYEKALSISLALGDRGAEGAALQGMGTAHLYLSEHRSALECFQRLLPIRRSLQDSRGEAAVLHNIGIAFLHLDETGKALEHLDLALPLWRGAGDRPGEARTLTSLGNVHAEIGEYGRAIDRYQEALDMDRALGDRSGEAILLVNLGGLYQNLGDLSAGIGYCEKALEAFRADGDPHGEIVALINLGEIYAAQREDAKALDHFEKAAAVAVTAEAREAEAAARHGIGERYAARGEHQKALVAYERALTIRHAIGARTSEAQTLREIGGVYSALGDDAKGREYLVEALRLARIVGAPNTEATILTRMVSLEAAVGRRRLAAFLGKRAVNLFQGLRANVQGIGKRTERAYKERVAGTYRALADVLLADGRLPEAQQVLGLLKEEEYFDFVRGEATEAGLLRGRADLTPTETAALKRYEEIGTRLASLGAERGALLDKVDRSAEENVRVARIEEDLTAAGAVFQKYLETLGEELVKGTAASEKLTQVREAQGLMEDLHELGAGTVAVYTLVGQRKLRTILVTPHVQKAFEVDVGAEALARMVAGLREVLQDPSRDPKGRARLLYDALVKPMADDLEAARVQTILWSLDGVLRYLPVSALWDGKKYLVERWQSVVITLASQARLKDIPKRRWRVLGLGVSKARPGFSGLPGVPDELRSVVKEAGREGGVLPGTIRLDEAFTGDAMTAALRDEYSVVHIASHFSFRPGNEAESFLLLGDGSRLTLAQVKALPNVFRGVDLLTLSACDTATGSSGGDGKEVEGFGVLAQRQGAKAVVATLWPVADESTAMLMKELYRRRELEPAAGKAAALQGAQVALLSGEVTKTSGKSTFSHPFYWAPFILIGNAR